MTCGWMQSHEGGVGFTPHYLAHVLYTIHNHSTTAQCPLQTLPRTYPSSTFHTLPTCPQELTNILILSIWGDIFLYIFDFNLKCSSPFSCSPFKLVQLFSLIHTLKSQDSHYHGHIIALSCSLNKKPNS